MTDSVASSVDPHSKNKHPIHSTGLKLSVLAAVWLALLILIKVAIVPFAFAHYGDWITGVEATHCSWMANLLGMEAVVDATVVATPYFAIRVTQACTGIDYLLYMVGLVALFPMKNRFRPIWLVVLPALLYTLLIFRLTFLLFIGRWHPTWVSTLHDTWNIGFILFFVGVWIAFVGRQLKAPNPVPKNGNSPTSLPLKHISDRT